MASGASVRGLFPNRNKAATPKGPVPPPTPKEPVAVVVPPPSLPVEPIVPLVKPSAVVPAATVSAGGMTPDQVETIIRSSGMYDTSVGSLHVEDPYNAAGAKISMPLYYVPSPRVEVVAAVGLMLKTELDKTKDLKNDAEVRAQRERIDKIPSLHFSKWFHKHNFLVKTYLEDVVEALVAVLNARNEARDEELSLIEQEEAARALRSADASDAVDIDGLLGESSLSPTDEEQISPAALDEVDTNRLDSLLNTYQSSIQNLVATVGEYVRVETRLEDDFYEAERANAEQFYTGSPGSLLDEMPLRTVSALESRRTRTTAATRRVESQMLSEKHIGEQLFALLKTTGTGDIVTSSKTRQRTVSYVGRKAFA